MARRLTLDFLKTETASGAILASAGLLAIAMANSPWAGSYFAFTEAPFALQVGAFREVLAVRDWAREGLMAIFFFVLGLEIKHEILRGELANPRRLVLPAAAALGGLAGPAAVYLALNLGAGGAPQGWPVPVSTDMALAIAALAVVGSRLPPSLRMFMLTVAIADNLGAVAIIALVFSRDLQPAALVGAAAGLATMALLGRWRRAPYLFFVVSAVLVWAFTLKSGVPTSLAGVASAFMIPIGERKPGRPGMLEDFLHSLHPYVSYMILPLFAFCAAGFSIRGLTSDALFGPVAIGVAAGLFFGKQLGVFGAIAAVTGLKLARRPTGASWPELYGVSLLCGVGFTMSLFIGALAFPGPEGAAAVRAGAVLGSLACAAAGLAVLTLAQRGRSAPSA
jgi:NhaA family Na+:H+ antiporter